MPVLNLLFLMYAACSSKHDPFDIILTRMIDEENNICLSQNVNYLNLQLVNDLRKVKCDYQIQINDMKNNHRYSSLSDIYKWIQIIREYPMVREQMIAIKQGQEIIMKQYEYELPNDLSK
ncbi:unnamed protein product [Rotaria sp. Silwood2]|nr:unnamed protein product [Rotaria sp. Silwood2]